MEFWQQITERTVLPSTYARPAPSSLAFVPLNPCLRSVERLFAYSRSLFKEPRQGEISIAKVDGLVLFLPAYVLIGALRIYEFTTFL